MTGFPRRILHPRRKAVFYLAVAAGLLSVAAPAAKTAPPPSQEALTDQLDTVIRSSIGLARTVQQHERAIASLQRDLAASNGDIAGRQRALAASEAREAEVLGALERLARNPAETSLLVWGRPLDRIRSGALMAAAIPALAGEARRLSAEIDTLTEQRALIAAREQRLAQERTELAAARAELARVVEQRTELRRQLVPEDADLAARAFKIGSEATDLPDLIRRADTETERRDRDLRPRAAAGAKPKAAVPAADPTRPKSLRNVDPQTPLVAPVAGPVSRRFGESDGAGNPSQGLAFAAPGGSATIVAPFDGRVEFAGPFRGYGTILIIGHGGGYHSVVAYLGRIDAQVGEWVVAGEPVGAAPEPAENEPGVSVYYELRRDGRSIDPQISLVHVE
jgi:septal ring factor EnvC (AmiA/AmiB activator)